MTIATISAFRNHSHFTLGFAIVGWVWMVMWLGVVFETPSKSRNWDFRLAVEHFMSLGLNSDEKNIVSRSVYATSHDLYKSYSLASRTGKPPLPHPYNTVRLAVCLTSLVAGAVAGLLLCCIRKWFGRSPDTRQ